MATTTSSIKERLEELAGLAVMGPVRVEGEETKAAELTDNLPLVLDAVSSDTVRHRELAVKAIRRGLSVPGSSSGSGAGAGSGSGSSASALPVVAYGKTGEDSVSTDSVKPDVAAAVLGTDGLVAAVAARVGDPSVSAAEDAVKVLTLLSVVPSAIPAVSSTISSVVAAAVAEDSSGSSSTSGGRDIMMVRLVSLVCSVSGVSDDAFAALRDLGLIEKVSELIGGEDVLLQMSIMNFLPPLARTQAGAAHVLAAVLPRLLTLSGIGTGSAASIDPFIGMQALTVVGQVFQAAWPHHDSIRDGLHTAVVPGLLNVATQLFSGTDDEAAVGVVGTLSSVLALDVKALQLAVASPELLRHWLCNGSTVHHPLRAAVLHGVGSILEHQATRPDVDDASCQALYAALGSECGKSTGELVLEMVKQVVDPDTAFGAVRVMRGAVLFPSGWGVKALVAFPGFLEFLFGGGGAALASKDGRLWKRSLNEEMQKSPGNVVLSDDLLEKVMKL